MHAAGPVREHLRGLTLVGIVTALLTLGSALPATAHEQLLESRPGDGEVLERPPTEVVLTFTSDVFPIAPIVLVRDAAGDAVQDGEPTVEGAVVATSLPPDLADGSYLVVWRVVSGDGHPIEGTYTFSVGVPQEGAGLTTAPGSGASGGAGAPDAASDPVAAVSSAASGGPGPIVVGAALATGAAVIALTLLLLRRRSRP